METVDELTGNEGGCWRVTTLGKSSHIFNLDRGTVTRIPGPGRNTSINDVERPLRTLDACKVGEVGHWTMVSDDYLTDFCWHRTSTIQRIERLTGMERAIVNTEIAFQNIAGAHGLYPLAEVAELLGVDEAKVREMLEGNQLIGFLWKEQLVFPGIQFTEDPGKVAPFVAPFIEAANDWDYAPASLTLWLYGPTTYFDGGRPVSFIDDPERLVAAFRAHVGVEW